MVNIYESLFWALLVVFGLTVAGLSGFFPSGNGGVNFLIDYLRLFFKFVSNCIPFAILTFGFISDLIHQETRASIPAIASLISVFGLAIVSQIFAWTSGLNLSTVEREGSAWCTIPGLEQIESPFIPMAFVITSTIIFYHYMWLGQPGAPNPLMFSIVSGVILLIQVVNFGISGECMDYYQPIELPFIGKNSLTTVFAAVAIGAITAGSAFGYTSLTNPTAYNPFLVGTPTNGASQTPSAPNKCPGGAVPSSNGCIVDGNTTKCPDGSSPNLVNDVLYCNPTSLNSVYGGHSQAIQDGGDENTFVAELYKNGQLVTESISA